MVGDSLWKFRHSENYNTINTLTIWMVSWGPFLLTWIDFNDLSRDK